MTEENEDSTFIEAGKTELTSAETNWNTADLSQTILLGLSKELKEAASSVTDDQARYLIHLYYNIQGNRIRSGNQISASQKLGKSSLAVEFINQQNKIIENQILSILEYYTAQHPMGSWMRGVVGIGPVLSACFLAYIDISRAGSAGAIHRLSGLDPSQKWLGAEKGAKFVKSLKDQGIDYSEMLPYLHNEIGISIDFLVRFIDQHFEGQYNLKSLSAAAAVRPWNSALKLASWKLGESFMKTSRLPNSHYGHLYLERKARYIEDNVKGRYAERAAEMLKKLSQQNGILAGYYKKGQLAPGHLTEMSKRYAVKMFISHLFEVWYEKHHGRPAPQPYILAYSNGEHTQKIEPFPSVEKKRRV
jgi:hypothetical protein